MTDRSSAEFGAILAELALLNRKMDAFGRALLLLAQHVTRRPHGDPDMSATTEALKTRLAKLDATVDTVTTNANAIAADAIAAEEADLAAIMTDIDAIEAKVEALPHTVAAAAAPTAAEGASAPASVPPVAFPGVG